MQKTNKQKQQQQQQQNKHTHKKTTAINNATMNNQVCQFHKRSGLDSVVARMCR